MSKRKPMRISEDTPPDPGRVMLGQPVQFVPASFYHDATTVRKDRRPVHQSVIGIICYINRRHRYFTVTYKVNNQELKESFKY